MTYFKSVIFFSPNTYLFCSNPTLPPIWPDGQSYTWRKHHIASLSPLLLVHCNNDLDQPSRGSLFIHNRLCSVDQEEFPTLPAKLLPICVTTKWKKTGLTAVFKSLRIQEDTFAEYKLSKRSQRRAIYKPSPLQPISCCAFTSPFHAGRERCSSAAMLGGHSLAPLWKITLIHPPCFTGEKMELWPEMWHEMKKINPNSISAAAHQGLLSRDHLDPGGFPRKDRDPNYLKSILPAPPSLCCLQVHAWHHSYRQPPRPWQQGGQPDRLGLCRRERMRRERGGEGES